MELRFFLIGSAMTLVGCAASQSDGIGSSSTQSAAPRVAAIPSSGRTTLTGTVERVWEDGFRLNTDSGAVRVDSWDLFGDNTRAKVLVGTRVSVTGEMSGGEFDAKRISPIAR